MNTQKNHTEAFTMAASALSSGVGGTWSPWGEAMDKEAAKQLGLDETHTIVMMATEVDFLEDAREAISEFEDVGLCSAEEVVEAIEEKMIRVPLPRGMVLVAMAPIGKDEPRTYGLVTVTRHDESGREAASSDSTVV